MNDTVVTFVAIAKLHGYLGVRLCLQSTTPINARAFPKAFGLMARLQDEFNLTLDSAVLFVVPVARREWRMRRWFIYALPRRISAPLWSTFSSIFERLPQAEDTFVIFPTRLFRRRFPCTE